MKSNVNKLNVAILASTNGTIIPDIMTAEYRNVSFSVLLSDRRHCGAVQKARDLGIPVITIDSKGKKREEWDREALQELKTYNIGLVILVGFMRILSPVFVREYQGRILNVHPSLLPKFAGGMDSDVHQAVIENGEKETGATIHIVTEELDAGPVIVQESVPVKPGETAESLKTKVQAVEKKLYPVAIRMLQGKTND